MSGPSVRARPRRIGGRGSWRPASSVPSSPGSTVRSGSTWVAAPRPRRPWRSSPRSSPPGTAARARRCTNTPCRRPATTRLRSTRRLARPPTPDRPAGRSEPIWTRDGPPSSRDGPPPSRDRPAPRGRPGPAAMLPAERVAGLILAAGAATRFGSPKIVARLGDRPMLAHVIDTAKAAGLGPVVVVLGEGAVPAGAGLDLASVRVVRNPRPEDGLSSSLRIGLAALRGTEPEVQAALVLLADQPLVRTDVIAALLAGEVPPGRTIVVPRYADGGGPNPALLLRAAWPLADEVTGDRGMGPLIAARPELVAEVPVEGGNPDVDTTADLALVEWAHRVRANRAQVDRVREVADGDFYAATSSLFVVDPRRSDADDPALAELRRLARPGETWLDIGAGAGRYALPLALIVREVIAVDPSPTMLAGLRPGMAAFVDLLHARGREPDVRTVDRMERFFGSRDEALASLRRQTWVAPDGPKDRRLQAALDAHVSVGPDGSIGLIDAPILRLSVATWLPR